MTLESLLKPAKFVDEQILKQYTKIAKRWEDGGRNIYNLSILIGLPSKYLIVVGGNRIFGQHIGFWAEAALYNWDFAYNLYGFTGCIKEQKTTDDAISLDPIIRMLKKINKSVRLPTFLSGASLVGKSLYDFVNYFVNGEPIDYTTCDTLMLGTGLLMVASSQYLKDRNPKLLDKEPFLQKAYDWIKERVTLTVPQPASSSCSLENYIPTEFQ